MSKEIKTKEIMKPKEVAEILRISEDTLFNLRIKKEGPPFFWVGSRPRYQRSAVENWIRDQVSEAG